jgi:DNA-binding MarR family transcriptional regulator
VSRVATGPAARGRVSSSTAASAGPISNALIRVTRLHVMRARQLLQGLGLHPGHELLLMHLWDTGPQRQADLAAKFETDSASMTRTVQRLERAGFVRRRPDPHDGRATLVDSTPAGMALRGRIERLWAELEGDTVGDMTASRRRQLLRGLHSLEANLSSAIAGDTALAPREVDADPGRA